MARLADPGAVPERGSFEVGNGSGLKPLGLIENVLHLRGSADAVVAGRLDPLGLRLLVVQGRHLVRDRSLLIESWSSGLGPRLLPSA